MSGLVGMAKGAGDLHERVAFDKPSGVADNFGGTTEAWTEQFQARAQFVYQSGDEAVQAARLAGRSVHKIRIRSSAAARGVDADWRMRDVRTGEAFNIVAPPEARTDRAWIYMMVEKGVP